ncbi:hypothetical protein BDN70DRAFT_877556 [Pholiota conissans]|uniref:Ras modification protein ERF4 n=1 Tax=Pholiota conissans TaxID=109636 RepID=A0A9P5Z548_9AGAR|nr:hypothetical protein BDN70DRAFT_877556 [Pholiota conissans]
MMSDPVLNPNPNANLGSLLPLVSEAASPAVDSTPGQEQSSLSDATAVHSCSMVGAERTQQSFVPMSSSLSSGGPLTPPPPPVAVIPSAVSLASVDDLNVQSTSTAGDNTGNGLATREHHTNSSTTTAITINPTTATPFTNTVTATTSNSIPEPLHEDDADISMTQEGELTMVAERTLVEDEGGDVKGARAHMHVKGPSSSSLPPRLALVQHDDPLRKEEEEAGEETVLEVVDFPEEKRGSTDRQRGEGVLGRVLEIGGEKAPSRRPSHLRVDVQGPTATATPWEDVEPPLENNLRVLATYYSPGGTASQKFRTLQNSGTGSRPLIPKSSYYFGPPGPDSAYGTPPVGQIGVHHPREVLRVERDYTGGELIQFAPIYPLELEGRLTPTQFLESINSINEILISAHSLRHSMLDHMLATLSLQISRLFVKTHFEKEMDRLQRLIEELNAGMYNPVGLNILWPKDVAFLYLEIEYY